MWLDDQSHRRIGGAFELHQGGPTNLRTVSLEFGIDAKREELSILTDLSNKLPGPSIFRTDYRTPSGDSMQPATSPLRH